MEVTMLRSVLFVLSFMLVIAPQASAKECKETYGSSDKVIRLATGSPGELGLVKRLADAFNAEHGTALCWKKAGSGASLKLLMAHDVDIVMVHAPAAEKKAVSEGWATKRELIGANEFYIVGPKNDPAGIAKAKTAQDAYARIAEAEALFFTRGDNSGTHKKELSIWKMAGISPAGDWYVTTKDFMMATLMRADREKGYFMTDSSTWAAGLKNIKNLDVLFRGDPYLINTYHALAAPTGATPMQAEGIAFIEFVGSAAGQKIIREYGKAEHGAPMYKDKVWAKQYDH